MIDSRPPKADLQAGQEWVKKRRKPRMTKGEVEEREIEKIIRPSREQLRMMWNNSVEAAVGCMMITSTLHPRKWEGV